MQDNLAYRYFAFISYSSKDQKAAENLQKKIESYQLPSVLRNELEAATGKKFPKRVKPLFRDMTDLSAGLLGKSILRELEDSRYLLVICSPDSAKSEWVNQEVENFILMGRYEKIIPYIIDGTPNSGSPETECFPPILRKTREFITYSHLTPEENAERQAKLHALLDPIHDELKGISHSGEGAKISRLKAIARMLEVAPDTIIQRDKQRQKKRIFWSSFAALFFAILFTCLGLWAWDRYYRVHVGYYADYVECWGVPKGIFPLSAEQRAHRQKHYRIYTQNQKVIRLEHVNSAGTPVSVTNSEFKDRPMIAVYPIYKAGRLVQRDALDNNGKVIISYYYSGDKMQKVEFKSMASDDTESSTVLTNITSLTKSAQDMSLETKRGEIGNMRLVRDSEGRVIEERFQKGTYDVPTTDEQGIAGFRYKLDEYGRVIEKIYLDQNGIPRLDKKGVARRTNQYDEHSNLVEAKYFDQNGNLTPNEIGWVHCINTYDKYGNIIKIDYFDASGKHRFLSNVYKYDDRGNRIEETYLDKDGKPCLIKDGYAKVKTKFDERGNLIELAYFGIDGKPCLCDSGYAKVTLKYDERGNLIEHVYFGIDGKPCLCKGSHAKVTIKYDERGNIIEHVYFDIDGKPCLCKGS
ncbi:MAG: toll/interleukin-1 receptor domain-containing protein, partial [Thermoguttaceae bacterium]|nr:toll/interleukin-1 receptor domain-containing protein [Thermoguttaceae bacterium]